MKLTHLILMTPFLPLVTAQTLPAPHFHHIHLNSTNPDTAVDFYTRQFTSASRTTVAGVPAVKTGAVYVLFNRVKTPPPTGPDSAIWHFGWNVPNERKYLETYLSRSDVKLLQMYTEPQPAQGKVYISSDTWPGTGGVVGLTQEQIAETKAKGVQPKRTGGFGYLQAPDNAIVEYAGDSPTEYFNHVHMYQEDPFCAVLWYKAHLSATVETNRTEADCKVVRGDFTWPALLPEGTRRLPRAGLKFDNIDFFIYARQGNRPLAPSRGQVNDHVGLSVSDLDAWIAKLRSADVKFLGKPYRLGEWRAVMIEGPSKEAIELVEIK